MTVAKNWQKEVSTRILEADDKQQGNITQTLLGYE